jgi:glycosyltransferase involved in cell wall biosynthesis
MSVGVPVFRTQSAGYSGLIREGITGRSCPIDHDAFIRGAIEFLTDRNALAEMGRHAAKHVRDHFTFDRQVSDTIELYYSIVQQSSGPKRA